MRASCGRVIGVLGGVGGAGTSTFAAVIAAAASGVLVDLDPASGGADVTLGIEAVPGSRWSAVRLGGGVLDPQAITDALPRWGGAAVLAADEKPEPDAVPIVIDAVRQLGAVVLDLGRGCAPAAAVAIPLCELVLVLTHADTAALAAARATMRGTAATSAGLVLRRGAVRPHVAADLVGLSLITVLGPLGRRGGPTLDPDRLPRRLARAAAGIVDGCTR